MKGIGVMFLLGLLTGCGTTILSSNQYGVVTDSATPNATESQRIADAECAKYHRVAKMTSGANAFSRNVTFDCVSDDTQNKESVGKSKSDMYTELKKLKELLDSKVITQDEFDAQKKKILSNYN